MVLFGCYIELYRSMLQGEKFSYESAKPSTHSMLAFMLLTGATYVVGLCKLSRSLARLIVLFVWTMACCGLADM